MKKRMGFLAIVVVALALVACGERSNNEAPEAETDPEGKVELERPSDTDLVAFKVYHHAVYLETTAKQAGGTNRLLHTTELPTEGTDPVVTPALDHLYTKAVIDLSGGPVIVELPRIDEDRYFSIQVADQEHYTIYDEIQPSGTYVIVREGKGMVAPEGATVIASPGDYPHLFVRVQAKTAEDLPNIPPIQRQIRLTAASSNSALVIENPIRFTLDTATVYPQNLDYLTSSIGFNEGNYDRVSKYIGAVAPKFSATGNTGMFGPIDSEEPFSDDPEYRAAAMVGHLGFPIHHAYYAPYFTNCDDEVLTGDKTEVFTFPYEPDGVELFWSVTRYSALTRNTVPGKNDLFNAFNTTPDANGNITVTFSVEDPRNDTYWMPVIPGEPYYFVVRYYKPDVQRLPSKPCG